ncbi:helix-turn-helix domain-containing protein [candidate division KSB1 bacterium]
MKVALTTGEVSKICNVSQKTVIKWYDDGLLEGYKIPGTKDRRVPIKSLNEFIQKNNIPISVLSTNFVEFYWDYFHQKKVVCKECVVYKNRIMNCYNYGMDYLQGWFFCESECEGCKYFEMYSDTDVKEIDKRCWDVIQGNEKCRECLAYKTGTVKCFDLRKKISRFCKKCSKKCTDCEYYIFLKEADLIGDIK